MNVAAKFAAAVVIAVLVAGHPASAGMVSYWTFDSDFSDSVGNNNGAAQGGAAVSVTNMMIGGGALALSGSSQYVNVGNDSSLNITGAVTITAWIYCNRIGVDNLGIYTRGYWDGGQSLLIHNETGYPLWCNNNLEGGSLSNNAWIHVAKTYDGNMARLYINGKQVASGPFASGGASNSLPTFIGAESWGGGRWWFGGFIDDVGVFSNSVDAAGIALINGLARTGGLGLDHFNTAQTVWAGTAGNVKFIEGVAWMKVSGLSGSLGSWSGAVSNLTATIVLDDAGNGIKTVLPPGTVIMIE